MLILDVNTDKIALYRLEQGVCVQKKTYFCPLPEVLLERNYEQDHHVLLPESAFHFRTIAMEYARNESFTIGIYKDLLEQKKEQVVSEDGMHPEYTWIVPCVGDVFGDEAIKLLLGTKGKISRSWHIYALQQDMLWTVRLAYATSSSRVTYVPKHLACLRYFTQLLKRSTFVLLVLTTKDAHLFQVRNGWYDCIVTAPLGTHILLEATEDQGVQKYLFDQSNDILENSVASKLLLESLGFYASALSERVGPYLLHSVPLVISSSLFSHALFGEMMQSTFQRKGVFVVPSSHIPPFVEQQGRKEATAVTSYLHFLV